MIAGGAIAVLNLFIMVLTTIRKQTVLLLGYLIASLFLVLFGKMVLVYYGLIGLSEFFLLVLIIMDLYCVLFSGITIWRRSRT